MVRCISQRPTTNDVLFDLHPSFFPFLGDGTTTSSILFCSQHWDDAKGLPTF